MSSCCSAQRCNGPFWLPGPIAFGGWRVHGKWRDRADVVFCAGGIVNMPSLKQSLYKKHKNHGFATQASSCDSLAFFFLFSCVSDAVLSSSARLRSFFACLRAARSS